MPAMLQRDGDTAAVKVGQESHKGQTRCPPHIQVQTWLYVIVLHATKNNQKGLKPNFKVHSSGTLTLFMQPTDFFSLLLYQSFQIKPIVWKANFSKRNTKRLFPTPRDPPVPSCVCTHTTLHPYTPGCKTL